MRIICREERLGMGVGGMEHQPIKKQLTIKNIFASQNPRYEPYEA